MTKRASILAQMAAARQAQATSLEENESYLTYELGIESEAADNAKLQTLMASINGIDTIVTTEGDKYRVNCFSLPEYIFGSTMAKVLGIVNTASAMFTDERQQEFSAILGIPYLAMLKANHALGAPAYFSKGEVHPQRDYNLTELKFALTYVYVRLELDVSQVEQITAAKLDKWFSNGELKAYSKLEELSKSQLLDSTSKFTIED